jgi:hypothetical protein
MSYAFISYVHEDSRKVDQLQRTLESAGIRVWRDIDDLWPGEDWRAKIREAISQDALVFIACFSKESVARSKSYQYEELTLAIEEIRKRSPEASWFIPVRLDDCEIPDRDIGGGKTLRSIQRADLFGPGAKKKAERLVAAILRILGRDSVPSGATPSTVGGPITNFEPATTVEEKVNGLEWPRERVSHRYAQFVREHEPEPFQDEASLLDDFERAEEEKKRARDQLWLEFEEAYGPPPEWYAEVREWDVGKYSAHEAANKSLLGNFWGLQILRFGGANGAWLEFPDLVLDKKIAPNMRPGIDQDGRDPTRPFRDWWGVYRDYQLGDWAEDFRDQRLEHVSEELQARQDAALVYASTAGAGNGLRIFTWTARAAIEILAIAMDAAVALNYWRPDAIRSPSDLGMCEGILRIDDLESRMPPEAAMDVAPLVRSTCTELIDVELTAHYERAVKSLRRGEWARGEELSPTSWLSFQQSLASPHAKFRVTAFRWSVDALVQASAEAVGAIRLPGVNLRRSSLRAASPDTAPLPTLDLLLSQHQTSRVESAADVSCLTLLSRAITSGPISASALSRSRIGSTADFADGAPVVASMHTGGARSAVMCAHVTQGS